MTVTIRPFAATESFGSTASLAEPGEIIVAEDEEMGFELERKLPDRFEVPYGLYPMDLQKRSGE